MSDKSLIDRWTSMMKVVPEERKVYQKSWSDNSKNLLSTEKKIYAIKIKDGEIIPIQNFINKKKKTTKLLLIKKWMTKCEWSLPLTIVIFSLVQVRGIERDCIISLKITMMKKLKA